MRARWIAALVAVAGLLGLPAAAAAGGWATVSLSSTPDGLGPGQPWIVEMEILQHGRTPLDGMEPSIVLTNGATGKTEYVAAKPTGRPGTYEARAVFPDAGRTPSTTASRASTTTRRSRSAAARRALRPRPAARTASRGARCSSRCWRVWPSPGW